MTFTANDFAMRGKTTPEEDADIRAKREKRHAAAVARRAARLAAEKKEI